MKRFIQKNPYGLLLFLICLILLVTNYVPNASVIGWDNLQTDLNPMLGIDRAFFSVWEEYQSFGLTAGMAHAADLPRAIATALLSLVLPQHMVRYVFLMGMITFGAFGMFRLLQFSGLENNKKLFAFLGSLFYLLNFATIQLVSLPYDPFVIFFGFLPWFIWIFLSLLQHNNKHRTLFVILNTLGMSAFLPQQIFAVYMLLLFVLGLGVFLHHRTFAIIKRFFLLIGLILIINSMWILPQIYFLATNDGVIQNTKQNQIVTDDISYLNKNKGNLRDFLLFDSFFTENLNQYQKPIFEAWNTQRNLHRVGILLYVLAGIGLLGLVKKSTYRTSFALAYLLMAVVLLSQTPPFEEINVLLRKIQIVNQVFRSPFTKFGFAYSCVFSYLFSMGLLFVYEQINRITHMGNKRHVIFGFFVMSIIVGQALPAFSGHYVATEMKIKIPSEYISLIDYLNTQDPTKRIALLPEYTFWGWFYHTWGYLGSGFLWYGVKQPVISRTFDVWSYPSESYFWEIKNTLEAEDIAAFQKVLEKYNVSYMLLDTSLRPIASSVKSIQYNRVRSMLAKSEILALEKQWGNLQLYRVTHQNPAHNFVSTITQAPNIGPTVKIMTKDIPYTTYGTYITTTGKPFLAYYPFLSLTSQTRLGNSLWGDTNFDQWKFTTTLPFETKNYTLSPFPNNFITNLYLNNAIATRVTPLSTQLAPKALTIAFPKTRIATINTLSTTVVPCGLPRGQTTSTPTDKGLMVLSEKGSTGCFSYNENNLDQKYGYIASITNKNMHGQPLFFYLVDQTKEQAYIEDRLDANTTNNYIIGPRFNYGIGYTFGFQNSSLTTIPAINTLSDLSLYMMPYDQIKNIHFIKKDTNITLAQPSPTTLSVSHPNTSLYTVEVGNVNANTTLILSQAYDTGWKAYRVKNYARPESGRGESRIMNYATLALPFWFGTEIKDHVKVNNWENGWVLPNSTLNADNYTLDAKRYTLVIVFLPQYLQYLGFLLLLLPIYWCFRRSV